MARRTGGRIMVLTAKMAAEICREWYVAFRNKGKGEEKCVLELLDAADTIEALEATQPKWISVEERLPEKDGKFIVCTAKGSVYCTRFKAYGKSGSFQTDINTHITHWMSLPEPPKE